MKKGRPATASSTLSLSSSNGVFLYLIILVRHEGLFVASEDKSQPSEVNHWALGGLVQISVFVGDGRAGVLWKMLLSAVCHMTGREITSCTSYWFIIWLYAIVCNSYFF